MFTSLIVIFIEQCELWHSAVFECCAQQWHSEIHRPLRFCMMHHPSTLSHTAYSHRFCASLRVSSFQSISSRICISFSSSASLDSACFYLSLCNTRVSCSAIFYTLFLAPTRVSLHTSSIISFCSLLNSVLGLLSLFSTGTSPPSLYFFITCLYPSHPHPIYSRCLLRTYISLLTLWQNEQR